LNHRNLTGFLVDAQYRNLMAGIYTPISLKYVQCITDCVQIQKRQPSGAVFFGAAWTRTHLNVTAQWAVACHRLDGDDAIDFREADVIESGCSKNLLQNAGGSFIASD